MKTHDELGIKAWERAALIEVRDYLRGPGREAFAPEDEWEEGEIRGLSFNMNAGCDTYDCGTVACIGGSAAIVMDGLKLGPFVYVAASIQKRANDYVKKHYVGGDATRSEPFLGRPEMRPIYEAASGIAKLFYPRPIADWDDVTPDVAAAAIDRFLETGDPDWVGIARERGIEIEEAFR